MLEEAHSKEKSLYTCARLSSLRRTQVYAPKYRHLLDPKSKVLFHVGTSRPFNLKEYQQETGKDFKRIVLYLCSKEDRDFVDDEELPHFNNYPNEKLEFEEPPFKKKIFKRPNSNGCDVCKKSSEIFPSAGQRDL